jgi:AraC family transcriptional regulator
MLSRLRQLGYHQARALVFPRHALALPAMLTSVGFHRETTKEYDWHGLKRGNAEFVLFQHSVSGWGMLEYEGRRFRVEPGQTMLLHFPHDNRYWLPPESEQWELLYVCLSGREVMRIWREIEKRRGPLVSLGKESKALTAAVRTIERVIQGEIESPFEASARAYEMAMLLLDDLITDAPGIERPDFVDEIQRFVRGNYREDIGVEDLARVAGLSRYHFSRVFKAWHGHSPGEYILDMRLRESARLLRETTLSVKEVAFECGFRDYNYFCRVFRRNMGISPGGFRKSGMY